MEWRIRESEHGFYVEYGGCVQGGTPVGFKPGCYENFQFDDIWRAIGRLWAAAALLLLAEVFMRNRK